MAITVFNTVFVAYQL